MIANQFPSRARFSGATAPAATSIEKLLGKTPLIKLERMFADSQPNVYLKLEQNNPGGSVKDRTAFGIIRHAERNGSLKPGMTIIESSSGNTVIGLSMFAAQRGYRVCAVCDRHLPRAKREIISAWNADIVYLPETPTGMDTVQLRIALAEHLASVTPDAVNLGQYSNPGNPQIHYETTGPEIYDAFDGDVQAVVMAVGTCGTISGVGRFLKEKNPSISVIGVEPAGSIIFGGEPGLYLIQGGGLNFLPPIFDPAVVDRGIKISDSEAICAIDELSREEGVLVGGTGGLAVSATKKIAGEFDSSHNIVVVIPDGGARYLDTIFNKEWRINNSLQPDAPPRIRSHHLLQAVARLPISINIFAPEERPGAGLDALRGELGFSNG